MAHKVGMSKKCFWKRHFYVNFTAFVAGVLTVFCLLYVGLLRVLPSPETHQGTELHTEQQFLQQDILKYILPCRIHSKKQDWC